ncbi:MAG: PilZ domain-containing protein [Nitrospirae bacterium]|nr:PilZ domain-containing protein [Nitrospirota bacterium]
MEKRKSRRIVAGYKAEIIYEGKSYEGIVDDLSEAGVGVVIPPSNNPPDIPPGAALVLEFQPVSGETLNLQCRVRWSYKVPPHNLTLKMGLEILNPPWDKSGSFL